MCQKLKIEFNERNNPRANFGIEYIQYWEGRTQTEHELKMKKRARELEDNVQQHVFKRVLDSFNNSNETSGSSEVNNAKDHAVQVDRAHSISEGELNEFWISIKDILKDTKDVPSCFLSTLNIVDLTNKHIVKLMKSRLTVDAFTVIMKRTAVKQWIADDVEGRVLSVVSRCKNSYHSLRASLRSSPISPHAFDAYDHHNILTIEGILTNFLDILEFNNTIINEYYERTCASAVVVPIIKQLFKRHPLFSTKWFEIQSQFTNSHHFDGIIFYKDFSVPVALAEFGGALCNDQKVEDDTIKVYRNAQRVMNQLSINPSKEQVPTVFILLFHQAKLSFETLRLVDNCTYIRSCHAKVKAPNNPEDLKRIAAEMPKIFAWRDALIESVVQLYDRDNESSSLDCAYDTLSVYSTP